jgi:hypothetical protein
MIKQVLLEQLVRHNGAGQLLHCLGPWGASCRLSNGGHGCRETQREHPTA